MHIHIILDGEEYVVEHDESNENLTLKRVTPGEGGTFSATHSDEHSHELKQYIFFVKPDEEKDFRKLLRAYRKK